jgi:AmmeMemoRadiSam system protein A
MEQAQTNGSRSRLTFQDKTRLLQIARRAIEDRLSGEERPSGNTEIPGPGEGTSAVLKEKRGVFVTLHKKGELRGCIGYIQGLKPLYQAVGEMAQAAAFGDPRFPPVSVEEWPELEVEISVLTPLQKVADLSEIDVGQHGLLIVKNGRSGLLLPQVASEYGWDRRTFLEHTCLKAGLPTKAWQDPNTEIYRFGAEVFGEKSID